MKQRLTGVVLLFGFLPVFYFGGCSVQAALPISEPAPIIKAPDYNETIGISVSTAPEPESESEKEVVPGNSEDTIDYNSTSAPLSQSQEELSLPIGTSTEQKDYIITHMGNADSQPDWAPLPPSPFYPVPAEYRKAIDYVLEEYQAGTDNLFLLPEGSSVPSRNDLFQVEKEEDQIIAHLLLNRLEGSVLELYFQEQEDGISYQKARVTTRTIDPTKQTVLYNTPQRAEDDLAWAIAQITGLPQEQWENLLRDTELYNHLFEEEYHNLVSTPIQKEVTYGGNNDEHPCLKLEFLLEDNTGDSGESILFQYRLDRNNCWTLDKVGPVSIPEESLPE